MNLYFVLEGERTETLLYPKWIESILPSFKQVDFEDEAVKNNYYIFSGGGIPSIYNHTINAIKNINDNPIYDKLIVCLDAEELTPGDRINEIKESILKDGVILNSDCEIHFIIQNICIETWFLGNRRIVKRNPQDTDLIEYLKFYNVIDNDPEKLPKKEGFRNKAHFHFTYLQSVFKERKLRYSKSRPKTVLTPSYLEELIKRTDETDHLHYLKELLILLKEIKVD